jgi:hypothetical protein
MHLALPLLHPYPLKAALEFDQIQPAIVPNFKPGG